MLIRGKACPNQKKKEVKARNLRSPGPLQNHKRPFSLLAKKKEKDERKDPKLNAFLQKKREKQGTSSGGGGDRPFAFLTRSGREREQSKRGGFVPCSYGGGEGHVRPEMRMDHERKRSASGLEGDLKNTKQRRRSTRKEKKKILRRTPIISIAKGRGPMPGATSEQRSAPPKNTKRPRPIAGKGGGRKRRPPSE